MEQILRTLVGFPSVTGDFNANHQLLEYVADYLTERGMRVRWFEEAGFESIIAAVNPDYKAPTVLLGAHCDVVDGPESLFTLRKQDGKYIGRGVLDMKCAIAAYLHAVDQLKDNLQDYDFAIMITSDEEIGGKDGVNGVVHLINQGYLPKVLVLPDGGQDWQLETVSNGFAHFTLQASGKPAHSSRPWEGDSAAFKLVGALNEIKELFKDHGPTTDTLNIGTIHTEGPINRIPDSARAELSIRITQKGGLADWEQTFTDICTRHQVKLILRTGWNPNFNDLENPYVKRYAQITEEVTGTKVAGFKSYAGSDARFFAEHGVPYANAYPHGGGHHSDMEWLATESLEQLGEIVRRYVMAVGSRNLDN